MLTAPVAQVRVRAGVTVLAASDVADLRPRVAWGHDAASDPPRTYAADHVVNASSTALQVTAPGTGMTVSVKSGEAWIDGYRWRYGATRLTISSADPTKDRIDLVTARNDGTVGVVTGTPASPPSAPALPANEVALAEVYVAAGATVITSTNLTDRRIFEPYRGDHLQAGSVGTAPLADGAVTGVKESVPGVGASYTVNPEVSGTIPVDIQLVDRDGQPVQRQVVLRCYTTQHGNSSDTDFELSGDILYAPANNGEAFAQTATDGTATLNVRKLSTTTTVRLLCEPVDMPGWPTLVSLTFA